MPQQRPVRAVGPLVHRAVRVLDEVRFASTEPRRHGSAGLRRRHRVVQKARQLAEEP
jgi:hypothetical protein